MSVRGLLSSSCQLQHTFERVSGSTSHMAFEAMLGNLLVLLSPLDSQVTFVYETCGSCGSCGSRGSFQSTRQGTKVDRVLRKKAREGLVGFGTIRANMPVGPAPLRLNSHLSRSCFDFV